MKKIYWDILDEMASGEEYINQSTDIGFELNVEFT